MLLKVHLLCYSDISPIVSFVPFMAKAAEGEFFAINLGKSSRFLSFQEGEEACHSFLPGLTICLALTYVLFIHPS